MSDEENITPNPEDETAGQTPGDDASAPETPEQPAEEPTAEAPTAATPPTGNADNPIGLDQAELDALIQAQGGGAGEAPAADAPAAETPAAEASTGAAPADQGGDNIAGEMAAAIEAESAAGEAQDDIAAEMAAAIAAESAAGEAQDDIAAEMAAAIAAESGATDGAAPAKAEEPAVLGGAVNNISTEGAENFAMPSLDAAGGEQLSAIDLLDDVELDVKIELGRTEMYIEDVLQLGVGSVVELNKLAGDPVDIFVNEQLVARGEVLVLNDSFCVRINDILAPVPEATA